MFRRKAEAPKKPTDEQTKIIRLLLQRLADANGKYDVEACWIISKLAHLFQAENLLLQYPEGGEEESE